MASLFERLGGESAVDIAVDNFYTRVLGDARLNRFFQGIDAGQLRQHQKAFLAFAFGGTPGYDGRSLGEAHKRLHGLGLDDTHFDAVVENLAIALRELGVDAGLIDEVALIAESVRPDILGRSTPAQ